MSIAVRVHLFHADLDLAKYLNCVLLPKDDLPEVTQASSVETLQDLRQLLLRSDPSVKATFQRLAFCTPEGAEIQDSASFSDYKALAKKSETGPPANTDLPTLDVYFRKTHNASNEWKRLAASEKLKEFGTRATGLSTVQNVETGYDHSAWQSLTAGVDFDHAVDMNEKQWDAVLRSNNLLSGNLVHFTNLSINQKEFSVPELQRAAIPAFRIRLRTLLESERGDAPIEVETVRMPIFQVNDQAYVEVYETTNYMAESMARSSFSKTDIEASVSGGGFGFSAAASAGFSEEEQQSWEKSHESSTAKMHITYNFPRVTLHLSEYSLEVTPECLQDLKDIASTVDYMRFHQKYGQIYTRRVVLGGRLYASQESSSFKESQGSQREEIMKVSASMSFKAPFVQGSASASHESGSSGSDSSTVDKSNGALTWHANGGDSLLCNNPPAWCPTVASHYYWRIQQQTDPIALLDLMEKMPSIASFAKKAKGHAP